MSNTSVPVNKRLRIWQQNLAKSARAQANFINSNTLSKEWDIILLQEPFFDDYGNTKASTAWRVIYPTDKLNNRSTVRSVILVNTALDTNTWSQLSLHESNDITAIQIIGLFGRLTIFNIYNDCTHSDNIKILGNFLKNNRSKVCSRDDDFMIWGGDFNRHHPLWEEERNHHLMGAAATAEAEILLKLVADHDMVMALPKDIPTLQARATKNWTRPDNVFCSSNMEGLFIRCEAVPRLRGPCTDHVPILSVIEIPMQKKVPEPTRNYRMVNWSNFDKILTSNIDTSLPEAQAILTVEQFQAAASQLTKVLQDTIEQAVPMTKPSVHMKRWWSSELEETKKILNRLSGEAHRYRAVAEHESHVKLEEVRKTYAAEISRAKSAHWQEFLEEAMERELWIANKYISNPTGDGGKTRIPTLKVVRPDGSRTEAITNEEKADLFVGLMFPKPPSISRVPDDFVYPTPLPAGAPITEEQLQRNISRLSPFKACGTDGIPNVILKKAYPLIKDHILHLFHAVFNLETYYPGWLEVITIVLQKPGKPAYDVAKAHRPVALLNTLAKLLTAIVAEDLSYLVEKHSLLPQTQFGGRPGRTTSDSMHLITNWTKHQWRQGRVVSILFLDIEGAFPNAVLDRLLHNMRKRRIPESIVKFIERLLTGRRTILKFDDYTSSWFSILNGIGQGDPISMIIYLFYNADLLDIARGASEMAVGYVDDGALLVAGVTFEENNRKLRKMMNKRGGAYQWAHEHHSMFEITKFELLHLTRKRVEDPKRHGKTMRAPRPSLKLQNTVVKPSSHCRFLGVLLDDELRWKEQLKNAVAKGMKYTMLFRRLTRPSTGLKHDFMERLYTAVAIPKMLYGADVWYTPVHKPTGYRNDQGSVGATRQLARVQRIAVLAITGALRSSPTDSLERHLGMLPLDLFMHKLCHRSAIRIATLPNTHPLYKVVRTCARHFVKKNRAPLHYLTHLYSINPDDIETITPVRQLPTYRRIFTTQIASNRADSLDYDKNNKAHIRIYTDGSGYERHAGAAAVMYKGLDPPVTLQYHLGPLTRNTTYEAEAVGVILGLQLLRSAGLPRKTTLSLDNQGVIMASATYKQRQSHYILDAIHRLSRAVWRHERGRSADFSLEIVWISGHSGAEGNELVDKAAKDAATGTSSDRAQLPKFLRDFGGVMPASTSALKQMHRRGLKMTWAARWAASPRYGKYKNFNDPDFSAYRRITKGFTRAQGSLMLQLRLEHVALNQYLARIGAIDSATCEHCGDAEESVTHFIFFCRSHREARRHAMEALGDEEYNAESIFSTRAGVKALLDFVNETGRLKKIFGDVSSENLEECVDIVEEDLDWGEEHDWNNADDGT